MVPTVTDRFKYYKWIRRERETSRCSAGLDPSTARKWQPTPLGSTASTKEPNSSSVMPDPKICPSCMTTCSTWKALSKKSSRRLEVQYSTIFSMGFMEP